MTPRGRTRNVPTRDDRADSREADSGPVNETRHSISGGTFGPANRATPWMTRACWIGDDNRPRSLVAFRSDGGTQHGGWFGCGPVVGTVRHTILPHTGLTPAHLSRKNCPASGGPALRGYLRPPKRRPSQSGY